MTDTLNDAPIAFANRASMLEAVKSMIGALTSHRNTVQIDGEASDRSERKLEDIIRSLQGIEQELETINATTDVPDKITKEKERLFQAAHTILNARIEWGGE
jgi:ABC-type uncharacterized transport system substrate-binding protein